MQCVEVRIRSTISLVVKIRQLAPINTTVIKARLNAEHRHGADQDDGQQNDRKIDQIVASLSKKSAISDFNLIDGLQS